jgi:trimeric autotransporter adhesin
MKTKLISVAICYLLSAIYLSAFAQGTAFTYQGQLQNNGSPANGSYNLTFSLFNNSAGGTAVAGPVNTNGILVSNGLFTVTLDFGSSVWNGETNWLQIGVETNGGSSFTTLGPRQRIAPVPYAIAAAGLSGGLTVQNNTNGAPNLIGGSPVNYVSPGVIGATISGGGATNYFGASYSNSVTSSFGTVGGGYDNTAGYFSTIAGGSDNTANAGGAVVGGGDSNHADGNESAVIGGALNSADGYFSTVGGGYENLAIGTGAFIGGGGYDGTITAGNYAAGNASVIGGGMGNVTEGPGTTVGGGESNYVGDVSATVSGGQNNTVVGNFSMVGGGQKNYNIGGAAVIAGGQFNTNQGNLSVVGGGENNYILGDAAVIAGGTDNTNLGVWSVVGGGTANGADAQFATVAGGGLNIATGIGATISGGEQNSATNTLGTVSGGQLNRANGQYSTVGGGLENTASGEYSFVGGGDGNNASASYDTIGGGGGNTASSRDGSATVSGGYQNTASGDSSTVPGGYNNTASGYYSFAAGSSAKAQNNDSFVWSDGSAVTTSTANNQFMVRASGGVIIYSSSGTSSGVSLATGGGSWSNLSDRNAKNNFAAVNPQAVLASVASLPMSTWSYKTEKGVKHLGPMSQDFYAAFCVGEDDRHIADVDEGGVALAAIQGLNQKLGEKDSEIQKLQSQNAMLEKRLDTLEQTIKSLAEKN